MKFKSIISLAVIAAAIMTPRVAKGQLLWKVTSPDGAHTSYILGTHHLAPLAVLDSITAFNEALAASDKVFGEIITAEMTQPATIAKMQQAALAPADSTLSKIVSPAQLDSIDKVIKTYLGPQMSVAMFEAVKPSMIVTTISMVQSARAIPNYNPSQQIDTEVQKRAAAAGKTVGGLETTDLQLDRLFGAPMTDQLRDLMQLVRHHDESASQAVKLLEIYRAGNLDAMIDLMHDSEPAIDEAAAERLIYSRNNNWAEFLATELTQSNDFIAVGALHLPGDRGLLKLLRDRGFTVEPM